jgi:hypothetical protein
LEKNCPANGIFKIKLIPVTSAKFELTSHLKKEPVKSSEKIKTSRIFPMIQFPPLPPR